MSITDAFLNQTIKYTKHGFESQLLRTLIALHLPFRAVENLQLQRLLRMLNRDADLPSRTTICKGLQEAVCNIELQQLKDLPPGAKISLALDCWTSASRLAFLAVKGYFIDVNWQYHEVLLGFEPIEGSHTGLNLCNIVRELLIKYEITDRVLAITTDNASNNTTMTRELQQALTLASFNAKEAHIPCLAHIIQLSLKELLGRIRVEARNDEILLVWNERDIDELDGQQGISKTIGKVSRPFYGDLYGDPFPGHFANRWQVRKLTVYINSSPQRRESFIKCQGHGERKLLLIQDIKIRWHSTTQMLIRAHKLRESITTWLQDNKHRDKMMLQPDEWRQVEYLIELSLPYVRFGNIITQTKGITIQAVFLMYEALLKHLEDSIAKLRGKRDPWKRAMVPALTAARDKLADYFKKTEKKGGIVYAIGTILAPQNKLSVFDGSLWTPRCRARYRKKFESVFNDLYKVPSEAAAGPQRQQRDEDRLASVLKRHKQHRESLQDDESEITTYLTEGRLGTFMATFMATHSALKYANIK
jgi:hypothetical protein